LEPLDHKAIFSGNRLYLFPEKDNKKILKGDPQCFEDVYVMNLGIKAII